MSKKVFVSPSRYIQGEGVIETLSEEVSKLAEKVVVIADEVVWGIVEEDVTASFEDSDGEFHFELFNGEASESEIKRLAEIADDEGAEAIVGVGGGKTLDTAKALADEIQKPVIIVPTTASTDAPTSGLSVIYSDDGVFEGYRFYDKNPDLVLVDTQIIVNAPAELFAAGIADALATFVEASAARKSAGDAMAGGKITFAGTAISKEAEKVLFDHGVAAYKAVQKKLVTPSVEAVTEANTLLSGLGFENGGLAAAHSIHNGFTAVDGEIHSLSHGQKVSYGILVQLVLEGRPIHEIKRYIDFLKAVDMPTTLEEMHLDQTPFEDLVEIGKVATADGETIENMSAEYTPEEIANAILAVDLLSQDEK